MRFLMVPMQFPLGPGQSYLTTELANALVDAGHEVEVLHLDWHASEGEDVTELRTVRDIRVVRCPPRAMTGCGGFIRHVSKFLLSGRMVARVARKHFALDTFDAFIAWMPAVAISALLPLIRRAGISRRHLIIWDFFPDHHREIGRLPPGLPFRIARAWEQRLLETFTDLHCTLPGNADYLRRNFRVSADQIVNVTPLWADNNPLPTVDRVAERVRHALPQNAPIAVFGGQFSEGRGFEQMFGSARLAQETGSPLHFLFVGDGRFAEAVQARAAVQANIHYRPRIPRDDYLALIAACDVGMAATTPGVTSFSIPSKLMDYLRVGLPVVCALEEGNDLLAIIENYGLGRVVPFGDDAAFLTVAEQLAVDGHARHRARCGAKRCLDELFNIRHAVSALTGAMPDPARALNNSVTAPIATNA